MTHLSYICLSTPLPGLGLLLPPRPLPQSFLPCHLLRKLPCAALALPHPAWLATSAASCGPASWRRERGRREHGKPWTPRAALRRHLALRVLFGNAKLAESSGRGVSTDGRKLNAEPIDGGSTEILSENRGLATAEDNFECQSLGVSSLEELGVAGTGVAGMKDSQPDTFKRKDIKGVKRVKNGGASPRKKKSARVLRNSKSSRGAKAEERGVESEMMEMRTLAMTLPSRDYATARSFSAERWDFVMRLPNKLIRDIGFVVACPSVVLDSYKLPTVSRDVIGESSSNWQVAAEWLKGLDAKEVLEWFKGKDYNQRLGFHFAYCVEYVVRFSPLIQLEHLVFSQQVSQSVVEEIQGVKKVITGHKKSQLIVELAGKDVVVKSFSSLSSNQISSTGRIIGNSVEPPTSGFDDLFSEDESRNFKSDTTLLSEDALSQGTQKEQMLLNDNQGKNISLQGLKKNHKTKKISNQNELCPDASLSLKEKFQQCKREPAHGSLEGSFFQRETAEQPFEGEVESYASDYKHGLMAGIDVAVDSEEFSLEERKKDFQRDKRTGRKLRGQNLHLEGDTVGEFDFLFQCKNVKDTARSFDSNISEPCSLNSLVDESVMDVSRLTSDLEAVMPPQLFPDEVEVHHWEATVQFVLYTGPWETFGLATPSYAVWKSRKKYFHLCNRCSKQASYGEGHCSDLTTAGKGVRKAEAGFLIMDDTWIGPYGGETFGYRKRRLRNQLTLSRNDNAALIIYRLFNSLLNKSLEKSYVSSEPCTSQMTHNGFQVEKQPLSAYDDKFYSAKENVDTKKCITSKQGKKLDGTAVRIMPRALVKGYLFYEYRLWFFLRFQRDIDWEDDIADCQTEKAENDLYLESSNYNVPKQVDGKYVFPKRLAGRYVKGPICCEKSFVNPEHWFGWWTRVCDFTKFSHSPYHEKSMWYIVPREEWLSPVVIYNSERERCVRVLNSDELLLVAAKVAEEAAELEIPRERRFLVAEVQWDPEFCTFSAGVKLHSCDKWNDGMDVKGAWLEASRGFVVEDTWPETGTYKPHGFIASWSHTLVVGMQGVVD